MCIDFCSNFFSKKKPAPLPKTPRSEYETKLLERLYLYFFTVSNSPGERTSELQQYVCEQLEIAVKRFKKQSSETLEALTENEFNAFLKGITSSSVMLTLCMRISTAKIQRSFLDDTNCRVNEVIFGVLNSTLSKSKNEYTPLVSISVTPCTQ